MTATQIKFREQRDLLMYLLSKETGLSSRKLSNYMADYDFDMSHVQITKIIAKFGDIKSNTQKNKEKMVDLHEKADKILKKEPKEAKIDEIVKD